MATRTPAEQQAITDTIAALCKAALSAGRTTAELAGDILAALDDPDPLRPRRETPEQAERARAERARDWPEKWGPFHRHFASDAVHRDGHPECDQPGTPRRVYVFDPDVLDAHEEWIARRPGQDHP